MSNKCIHGMDDRFCAECKQAREREPLPPDPLRHVENGEMGFTLFPARRWVPFPAPRAPDRAA